MKPTFFLHACLLTALAVCPARGDVLLQLTDAGNGKTRFELSGTLDLSSVTAQTALLGDGNAASYIGFDDENRAGILDSIDFRARGPVSNPPIRRVAFAMISGNADGQVVAANFSVLNPVVQFSGTGIIGFEVYMNFGGSNSGTDTDVNLYGDPVGVLTVSADLELDYDFANFLGPTPETFVWEAAGLPGGHNRITLNIAVPEPATAALLLLGAGVFVRRRSRLVRDRRVA